jgi:GAF domain-containing protein
MSSTRPIRPNGARAELSQLGRAASLLEDAQRTLARAESDAAKRNEEPLRRILDLEESLGEMEQLLVQTERQAAQLANLYVATYQLHASLDAAEVRAAIADIAVNLLGAERFAILLKDESGQLLMAPESAEDAPGESFAVSACRARYDGGDALILDRPRSGQGVFFPVLGARRAIGLIYANNGRRAAGVQDVELMELATAQVGLAFENELLRRQLERLDRVVA